MSWPPSVVVDAVFIAVYLILTGLTLFNVTKHGHGKQSGFIYLLIFSLVRLIANILLVYTYHTHYKHSGATTWGFLLQGLGFSFLISASLGFYGRAIYKTGEQPLTAGFRGSNDEGNGGLLRGGGLVSGIFSGPPKATIHKLLHLVNFVALILLIDGYTSSNLFSSSNGNADPSLLMNANFNTQIKVGDLIYCCLVVIIALLCFWRFSKGPRGEQRSILFAMLVSLPFMLIRSIYVASRAFSNHPLQGTLAIKVMLEYVVEVIILLIYSVMGFLLSRQSAQVQQAADNEQPPMFNHQQVTYGQQRFPTVSILKA